MDLFHYHLASGNFGDDLNLWLWDRILPGWREALPGHLLVGVGTLINDKLPRGVPKMVMGSGVGYGRLPDVELLAECRFVAVRGPRSAKALGLPPEKGIVDPAVLIADLPEFQGVPKTGKPVFVPHISSLAHFDWARICTLAGVEFVSPAGEADEVIRRIAGAPLVIAESMHAAIFADAFRVPWHVLAVTPEFNYEKWHDWSESLGVSLVVHRPSWERVLGRAENTYEQRFLKRQGATPASPGQVAAGTCSARDRWSRQVRQRLRGGAKSLFLAWQLRVLRGQAGQASEAGRLRACKTALHESLAGALKGVLDGN